LKNKNVKNAFDNNYHHTNIQNYNINCSERLRQT